MHMDPNRIFKAPSPNVFVVLDAETRNDHEVHERYLAVERVTDNDGPPLSGRIAASDPRIFPRWPCQQIRVLSWLVMTEAEDGLRPVRMETRGAPEHDEAGIVESFFNDMASYSAVTLVTYNGFGSDVPRLLLAAAAAGHRLPASLAKLHAPWPRGRDAHIDLMTEVCGGAERVHLAEIAAKLGIPAKTTCHPDRIHELMARGKWSSVKAVAEGDVLTTGLLLMRWRALLGGSTSSLEATQRMSSFVANRLSHRPYAAVWQRYGEDALRHAFARETRKIAYSEEPPFD